MIEGPRAVAESAFREEDLSPQTWSNEPGYRYGAHHHPYHKVLFCIDGSITFHTPDGDILLMPGDRLDLPPGTTHSATVGDTGVACMEAARG